MLSSDAVASLESSISMAHSRIWRCAIWGVLVASLGSCSLAPRVQYLEASPSLRGLSAWSNSLAWVSGSGEAVAMSLDGGRTWQQVEVPVGSPTPAEPLDYRDLEVLSPAEIVLMAAGPGENSRVFRTQDGGTHWSLCAINQDPEGFWDGIAFWDAQRGLLVGDPLDGKLTILRTSDGGRSWHPTPTTGIPAAIAGEYAFAASGTSLAVAGDSRAWIATGGSVARVYRSTDGGDSWEVVESPLSAGTPGSGIFSIAFRDAQHGVIVGGDYERPEQVLTLAAWTEDGGQTWHPADSSPAGYRSAVSWQPRHRRWVAVGPTGIDISKDGRTWNPLPDSLPGFHSVDGNWMSGADGRAAYLP